MNALEELKQQVRAILNGAFPACAVLFEPAGDDPFLIGVGVYGVRKDMIKWVENKILDLDERIFSGTDFILIPLVRDEATTEKFYPQFSKTWAQMEGGMTSNLKHAEGPFDFRFFNITERDKWAITERPAPEVSANQELALAA